MGNYSHVCQCLTRLATLRRRTPVTIAGDRRKTGEQFVEGVLDLARGLVQLGLRNGDLVAICALNSDSYLEWLLAVTFVGGIVAPLNYRWSLEEASFAMEVVRPVMLVTDECSNYWYSELQLGHSMPFLRWHVSMNLPSHSSNSNSSKEYAFATETLKKPALNSMPLNYSSSPGGAALICFTSGTTGRPKGVTISHSALIIQSLAKIACVGYSEDDVYLHNAPLCHIGGISSAMAVLMAGGCHVFIPKFEAKLAIETMEKFGVTSFITVPAIMADLISLLSEKQMWKGKETVRKILNGGGGLSVELIKAAAERFPRAKLLSAYGMTETCSSMTFMTLYEPTNNISSNSFYSNGEDIESSSVYQVGATCVGKPAPHVDIKISSEDSSNAGRILTRGSHVMIGYWGQIPTKSCSTADEGWLDTGDIGKMDVRGNVWLIGRTKGRIKSGGENVYPEEVEAVVSQHPGVSGVVVVGLPEARLTEIVVACVQLTKNWSWTDDNEEDDESSSENKKQQGLSLLLSSEILRQFCREKHLTGFKIPRKIIVWRKQFPLTTTGKLRRDELRRQVIMSCNTQILPSNL